MINAIAIEFENIGPFTDKQRFEFSGKGLHLITGVNLDFQEEDSESEANNGIGKSFFSTIVRFTCFGYAKDTNKNILINKTTGKNLRTRFEFSVKDDIYAIERYKKHDEHKDGLYLYKNNQDISASNKTQTQQDIIDLLVITDDTYLKCSLFTREDNPQFLSLTPTNRSKIFENIVHLSKFKKHLDNVKSKKKSFSKMAENVEIDYKAEQKNYTNLTDTFQDLFYATKNKRADLILQLKNAKNKISKEAQAKYDKFVEYSSIQTALEEKLETEQDAIIENKKLNDRLDAEIKNIKSKIKSNEEIIKDKTSHSQCENCQHVPESVHKQIDILENKNIALEQERISKDRMKITDHSLAERSNTIKERLDKINKKIDALNITQEEIDLIENQIDTKAIIEKLNEAHYWQAKQIIDKLRLSALKVKQYAAQKSDLVKHLAYCDKAIALLDIDEEESIKQHVMSEIVPVFNELLQKIVDYIYENTMVITFDNNLNESITYKNNDFDFQELSTGEKQRLDICISFSIMELTRLYLGGFNILFLDEIFSNIDEYFIIKFLKLIKEKYQENTAIYLISHSAGVRENAEFDSYINLVMENETSTFTVT